MKRTRYDSEYEKVRQKSAKRAPQPEFPDDDRQPDMIDRARIEAAHADFKARMAELHASDKQREAEMKLRVDAFTMESNLRVMVGEYQQAGVLPPFVDEDGRPKYSLSFLLKMGWSIDNLSGQNVLVRPAQFRKREERHENYQDQGS